MTSGVMHRRLHSRTERRLAREAAKRDRRLDADRELAATAIGEPVTATTWVSPSSPWWFSLTVVASFSLATWAGAGYLLAALAVMAVVVFTGRWRRWPRILLAANSAGVTAVHFRYRRVHRVVRLLGHEFAPTSPGSNRWTVGSQVATGDLEQLEGLALAAGLRQQTVVVLQPRWPRAVYAALLVPCAVVDFPIHWLSVLGAAGALQAFLLFERATARHALVFNDGTWQLWRRNPWSRELTDVIGADAQPAVRDPSDWSAAIVVWPRTFAADTVGVRRMRRVDPRV